MKSAAAVAETEDRTVWHLWNWKRWHHQNSAMAYGFPNRASGGIGNSHFCDFDGFDSMCAIVDAQCAHAVDTIIDDLPNREKWTVYNRWMATVFRYEGDPDELYGKALDTITRELAKRGMW